MAKVVSITGKSVAIKMRIRGVVVKTKPAAITIRPITSDGLNVTV